MTEYKLIDSSLWIAYLFEGTCVSFIESEEILLLSALSLFEIKRKLHQKNIPNHVIMEKIEFVKKRSLVIPLSSEIAEQAAELSIQHNLPAIDSLIYTTTLMNDAVLITLDNDLRGLKNVIIPERV